MTIQAIQTRDADAYRQRVTLGGVVYEVRLVWRERVSAWYVDVYARDGSAIIVGRRLSQGWTPTAPVRDILAGLLLVTAPEGEESEPTRSAFTSDDGRSILYAPDDQIPPPEPMTRGRVVLS